MERELGVVVVAAGSSKRMGGVDKIFAPLGGKPVLAHTLLALESAPSVGPVVVVLSAAGIEQGRGLISELGLKKVVAAITGGDRRQDSARRGVEYLAGLSSPPPFIAIHDGPRPFVSSELIERGLSAARETGAAIPGIAVTDTIKIVDDRMIAMDTPIRHTLRAVQTPQVFRTELIQSAHREVHDDVTDDATMVELIGGRVVVYEGDNRNIKITTADDLTTARQIIASSPASGQSDDPPLRWGTGFDGHALKPGNGLTLGGISIEFDHSLEGHSDGDVLLHAISSSILGGAGLGDLGRHFPSSSPDWKDADSSAILGLCVDKAKSAGWGVEFVDATIIAQRPRLGQHLSEMAQRIAEVLGVDATRVSIKVTSTDQVGAIGNGEGIAAQAIATLRCLRSKA